MIKLFLAIKFIRLLFNGSINTGWKQTFRAFLYKIDGRLLFGTLIRDARLRLV